MIDKKELRYGNLVVLAHESNAPVGTIKEIHASYVTLQEYELGNPVYSLIVPIKLTSDWLEKLGFEKEKTNDVNENDLWSIQVANNTSLYYQPDSGGNDWYLSHEWNNNHFKNDFWNNPKYVHQIMNLFYWLTGEELTIKS